LGPHRRWEIFQQTTILIRYGTPTFLFRFHFSFGNSGSELSFDEVISRFGILKDTLCNCCSLPKMKIKCNMFFFMERQLNMCGSTLEGHWQSELTTGGIKNQITPSTS